MSRRWRFRRASTVAIVVEAVMLAAAVTAGVIGLNELGDARARVVDQIDPALTQAQNLNTALLNQESGLRGYELTGRADFRTSYGEGKQQQNQAVLELIHFGVVDGTEPGNRLQEVLAAAGAWQRTAEDILAAGTSTPQTVDRARVEFDAVRGTLNRLRETLEQARQSDRQHLLNTAVLLNVVLGAIAGLLIILVALLTFGLHRAIVRPVLALADKVRDVTEHDVHREIPDVGGPRELVGLAGDIEAMRRRIVAEVSELHRAHELLDVRTQELERSNSDLEQFAYVASHDLQEPLRKVTSFCQLLQRRYADQLDERAEQYIAYAVDGAKRMQVLINDLLTFSRVGRRATEFVTVDTGELVEAAIANLGEVVEETGARIVHGELPAVRGEASLLTAVFQNLIGNAIKFRGDVPPEIRVDARRDDGEWTFSVTDNGIGIEPEYAERIFVIFQRLHTRTEYPGTGIGLALSRKIIEYHGGRIWLDTANSDGHTRFRFTLPALED